MHGSCDTRKQQPSPHTTSIHNFNKKRKQWSTAFLRPYLKTLALHLSLRSSMSTNNTPHTTHMRTQTATALKGPERITGNTALEQKRSNAKSSSQTHRQDTRKLPPSTPTRVNGDMFWNAAAPIDAVEYVARAPSSIDGGFHVETRIAHHSHTTESCPTYDSRQKHTQHQEMRRGTRPQRDSLTKNTRRDAPSRHPEHNLAHIVLTSQVLPCVNLTLSCCCLERPENDGRSVGWF